MLPIHLILSGPQEAPYPNGGDEAYWMGQVAGAITQVLSVEEILQRTMQEYRDAVAALPAL